MRKSAVIKEPQWAQVTAVFGGTFDPPHLGHREAVRGLFSRPGVKRVLILPAAIPPLKQTLTSTPHRVEMAKICFSQEWLQPYPTEIEFDLRELSRSGKSYTYDTLQELRVLVPDLAFVIGADQLADLKRWHRFPEVLGLCHWLVLERKPAGQELSQSVLKDWESSGIARKQSPDLWQISGGGAATWLKTVPTDAPAISSTSIREAISRTGQVPAKALYEPVSRYLYDHRLYGTSHPQGLKDRM